MDDHGCRFDRAKEILFYEPGFTVKNLEAKGDDTLKVTVAAGPECTLGMHAYRIRSLGGISNLRLFSVGMCRNLMKSNPITVSRSRSKFR